MHFTRLGFDRRYHAADGGIQGGFSLPVGPVGKPPSAPAPDPARATEPEIGLDRFVQSELARRLPAEASLDQKQALLVQLEEEFMAHSADHQGLKRDEYVKLMEDRAASGWELPPEHPVDDGATPRAGNAYDRAALALNEYAAAGASPLEVARMAAALVRADLHAKRPIDGGDPAHFQWRALIADASTAKALVHQFPPAELAALRQADPAYFQALDAVAEGEATRWLAHAPRSGLIYTEHHFQTRLDP